MAALTRLSKLDGEPSGNRSLKSRIGYFDVSQIEHNFSYKLHARFTQKKQPLTVFLARFHGVAKDRTILATDEGELQLFTLSSTMRFDGFLCYLVEAAGEIKLIVAQL